MSFEISAIEGDFKKIQSNAVSLVAFMAEAQVSVPRTIAEKYHKELIQTIEGQKIPSSWALLKRYRDRKRKQGLDERVFVASGGLLRALGVHRLGRNKFGAGVTGRSGRSETLNPRGKTLLYVEVLKELEEGTYRATNPVKRPLFRFVTNRLKRDIIHWFNTEMAKVAARHLTAVALKKL